MSKHRDLVVEALKGVVAGRNALRSYRECKAALTLMEQDVDTGWVSVKDRLPEVDDTVLVRGVDKRTKQDWYAVLTLRDFGWAIAYDLYEWNGSPPVDWQTLPPSPLTT